MRAQPSPEYVAQRALVERLAALHGGLDARNFIETHISWVLVDGGHAYKIKKAVNPGFLDFRTLEARRKDCEEELRLNRRLAPALYLDVVTITGTPQQPAIGGEGPALEYAVKMRAFAQEDLLSHVLERGDLAPAHIDALAQQIATFHAHVAVAPPHGPHGVPEEILPMVLAIFDDIRPCIEDDRERALLRKLEHWTKREHAARTPVFRHRLTEGFVRECHGDLHLANIALVEGEVTVFDGIEFSDTLRWIDVACEIAFTVMDLEDRGAPRLAHRFLDRYLEITGDYAGLAVLRFYLVNRAMVRAMVACLRAAQMDPGPARTAMRAEYHGYLDLADRYAHRPHPAIVLMHGLAGCGKTRVAQALLEEAGAVRVRTDVERKRMRHLQASPQGAPAPYAAEENATTYRRVAALAREIAGAGFVAIVDAASLARWQRDLIAQTAADLDVAFVIVHLDAAPAVLRERVAARTREGSDASEATVAVLEWQMRSQEPLAADELALAVAIDTESPLERIAQTPAWREVLARIGAVVNAKPASNV